MIPSNRIFYVFSLILSVAVCIYSPVCASERDRFTVKTGTILCKSLSSMNQLQDSITRKDGKSASFLRSGECSIAPNPVVVFVIHEEDNFARVQVPVSGKYFWVAKQALR